MISELRSRFNSEFDPSYSKNLRERIASSTGEPVTFPLSDSPVFVPQELVELLACELRRFFEILRTEDYRREAAGWVPSRHRAAGPVDEVPVFSCWDFGLGRREDGQVVPHMLECQGCSSLMGIVPWFGLLLQEKLGPGVTPFLSHDTWEDYRKSLAEELDGALLIDEDTAHQKLRTDFWALRNFLDLGVVDLSSETVARLDREPRRLYNRIVPAEVHRAGNETALQALFGQARPWVSHPNWFFMLSKRSLCRFAEVSDLVPRTEELTPETAKAWASTKNFVLKPCNDFGGRGVILDPTPADLEAALRSGEPHLLQERIDLARVVQPPTGPQLYCDLRVLCIRDRPVSLFVRLARDLLCNISFNGHYEWCGITVGLVPRSNGSPPLAP